MTLPLRLITLHFSHIGLTDDLTFMPNPPLLRFKIGACLNILSEYAFFSSKMFYYTCQSFSLKLTFDCAYHTSRLFGSPCDAAS